MIGLVLISLTTSIGCCNHEVERPFETQGKVYKEFWALNPHRETCLSSIGNYIYIGSNKYSVEDKAHRELAHLLYYVQYNWKF